MEFNPDNYNENSAVVYCIDCDCENPTCDCCGKEIKKDDTYYCDPSQGGHLCFFCYGAKRNRYYKQTVVV